VSARTILIAHRSADVRDRFATALADARHAYVLVDSAATVEAALADPTIPVNLVLLDLGLDADGPALVGRLRQRHGPTVSIVVFAGTLTSASAVPALTTLGVGYVNEHAATAQILPALAPHLFPDNFNRRGSVRIPLGVPVTYRAGPTLMGAVTLDLGRGGLAIRTMTPLPRGTALQVRFKLPGAAHEIDITARVAWSSRKTGMGVQYEKVSSNDQRAIDAFVDAHS
jgi:uncharacterized protein (TIGR02266 family)